jgi:hypothetical protein
MQPSFPQRIYKPPPLPQLDFYGNDPDRIMQLQISRRTFFRGLRSGLVIAHLSHPNFFASHSIMAHQRISLQLSGK